MTTVIFVPTIGLIRVDTEAAFDELLRKMEPNRVSDFEDELRKRLAWMFRTTAETSAIPVTFHDEFSKFLDTVANTVSRKLDERFKEIEAEAIVRLSGKG